MKVFNIIMGIIFFYGFVCLTIISGIILIITSRCLLSNKIKDLKKQNKCFLVAISIFASLLALTSSVVGEVVIIKLILFG